MRKILITGGAGFIGFHLASKLSEDPCNEILLLDDFSRGRLDDDLNSLLGKPNVSLSSLGLTSPSTYQSLGNDFDEVYHLAAIIGVRNVIDRPTEVLRVNATTTLLLLEWFSGCGKGKFLFSSTSEAYAWTQHFYELPIPTPENVPLSLTDLSNPRSAYAGSKIFGELLVTQYCRFFKKPFVIVRFHNVYGPRMGQEHVVPELYRRAWVDGQDPLEVYSVEHKRAFCYVSDAVDATIASMRSDAGDNKTINIGNDSEEVLIRDLAVCILKTLRLGAGIEPKSAGNDPIKRRCPDIHVARQLLNYRPSVSLEDGLKLTLSWYRANLNK